MIDGQGLKLIEPLRELFKDEVRELGRQLGVHEDLVMRYAVPVPPDRSPLVKLYADIHCPKNSHPFPGPGIGVRIIGECTPERVEIARQADHVRLSDQAFFLTTTTLGPLN